MEHMNVGLRRHMVKLPRAIGRRRVASLADRARAIMDGLTEQHRTLHHFLVAELPRSAKPLSPEGIADQLGLSAQRVAGLIDDLGDKKALIARDADGAVTWGYPVTVDDTPHRLCFEGGDRLFAA
jgi:hypothetical protein